MKERIQKIISQHGLCSRREAERLIADGRVCVNGMPAVIGARADDEKDRITIDGVPLVKKSKRVYIMLNKPRGYICTLRDELGRKTVTELVRECGERVYPVGRLDGNSEGLLLLTNDGRLTNALTHPSGGVQKVYSVRVEGEDIAGALERLRGGVALEDGPAQAGSARLVRDDGARAVIELTVTEGRKHLVRNMCAAVGLDVKRLIRISEGGLTLDGLKTGKWRYLRDDELEKLRRFI